MNPWFRDGRIRRARCPWWFSAIGSLIGGVVPQSRSSYGDDAGTAWFTAITIPVTSDIRDPTYLHRNIGHGGGATHQPNSSRAIAGRWAGHVLAGSSDTRSVALLNLPAPHGCHTVVGHLTTVG